MKYVNPFSNRTEELLTFLLFPIVIMVTVGVGYLFEIEWFRNGKTQYLLMAAGFWLFFWLREANPFVAAFCAYNFVRWCFAGLPEYGIVDVLAPPACLALGLEIHRRINAEAICKLIAYLALMQAAYAYLQSRGHEPFFDPKYMDPKFIGKPIGTLGEHMMLGLFIAMGSIYFFCTGQRWHFLICTAMVLVVGSSTAMIALMAAGLYGLFRWNAKAAAGVSAVSAASLLACSVFWPSIEAFSFSGRLTVWPRAVDAWLNAPIFGNGPGSWSALLPMWRADKFATGMDWNQVHNDWLQLLAEQGAIGWLILMVGLIFLLRRAQRLPAQYGAWLVLLAVNALGNFTAHMATFGLIAAWLAVEVWNQEPIQGEKEWTKLKSKLRRS